MSGPAAGEHARYRLSRRARRALHAMIPVVCPPAAGEHDLAGAILDHVELTLGALPAAVRAGLLAGLHVYDAGAVMRHGRRAGRLDVGQARSYFAAWRRGPGPARELARALKGLLCLAYYEQPRVQEAMGYQPGAWIEAVRERRLRRHAAQIQRHEAHLYQPDPLRSPRAGAAPGRRPHEEPRA